MTVRGATKALEKTADTFSIKLVLGAGTVLDPETVADFLKAGSCAVRVGSERVDEMA